MTPISALIKQFYSLPRYLCYRSYGDGNLIQKTDETAIPKRRDCRFSLSVFNGFGQKM